MKATEVIQHAFKSTQYVFNMYLSDLSDADLLVRPAPNANHAAWQIGHLIASERGLGKMALPNAKYPELPAGFDAKYTKETANQDTGFLTKAEYLALFDKMRAASIEAVGGLTDADLDKPTTGPMAKYAPTVAALLLLTSNHTLMHAGQFTVTRRKLGKPVLF